MHGPLRTNSVVEERLGLKLCQQTLKTMPQSLQLEHRSGSGPDMEDELLIVAIPL